MKRFYFTVSFLGKDINETFLVGRCLKILHGFYYKQDIHDIGVSFPDWSNNSIGKRLVFVSTNESSLKFLKVQKYFVDMVELNYFLISNIGKCILDSKNAAVFNRNHKADELTVCAQKTKLRRLIKRAEKRGEIYQPKGLQPSELIIPFHYEVPMSSRENGNDFAIKIEKKDFSKSNGNIFNSYGLSTNQKNINPVPIIFDEL